MPPISPDKPGAATNPAGYTETQLLAWRARLQTLAEELTAANDAAGGTGDAVELDQSKVGRLSRMDALQMQAMARAEAARRSGHTQRVTIAMARIDQGLAGDFGLCRDCEEAIDPKRLAVDPAALLCFDCASAKQT